jgi:hypothetical protein
MADSGLELGSGVRRRLAVEKVVLEPLGVAEVSELDTLPLSPNTLGVPDLLSCGPPLTRVRARRHWFRLRAGDAIRGIRSQVKHNAHRLARPSRRGPPWRHRQPYQLPGAQVVDEFAQERHGLLGGVDVGIDPAFLAHR